jgi:Fe-S cluster biogenesis protein NfuA
MALDDRQVRERVARLEALLERIEALPDGGARSTATETIQALLDLYGEGLARIMEYVAGQDGPGGGALLERFAGDELVSHLLLLHGLHPVDVEVRVRRALEEVRPYLRSHGGDVEMLGVEGGVAHVRLKGSCNGCPGSTLTLKTAIEEAIQKAAPDLDGIAAEGVSEAPSVPAAFIPAASLRRREKRSSGDNALGKAFAGG